MDHIGMVRSASFGSLPPMGANEKKPLILLAPGAGAPSTSAWMERWDALLSSVGDVVRFDYDYMREGRKAPDRLPKLITRHRAALEEALAGHSGPVVLAGKSMGGRVGCHLATQPGVHVDALVCLGYPLKGAGKNAAIRDQVLIALETPVIFCQGSKDAMGPLDLFAVVRESMRAPSELFAVDGGNHSLELGKRFQKEHEITQGESDAAILDAIASFLAARL